MKKKKVENVDFAFGMGCNFGSPQVIKIKNPSLKQGLS
jgi:hypothetical protein